MNPLGTLSEEDLLLAAKLAEKIENYDDMVSFMTSICKLHRLLTVEERNLFLVAFKNVIGRQRANWRILCSVQQKEKSKEDMNNPCPSLLMHFELLEEYLERTRKECTKICHNLINIIDEDILPYHIGHHESILFFYKTKGDYYRYLCEFYPKTDTQKNNNNNNNNDNEEKKYEKYSKLSIESYRKANELLTTEFKPTNPLRLGMACSMSTFYYEILNEKKLAYEMCTTAFQAALEELDNLTENSYKDSTVIMQIMRDNMNLWDVIVDDDDDDENVS